MASTPKLLGLKRKGVERQTFTVKIDGVLMEELTALEKRVDQEAPDYKIERVDVVEQALKDFIKIATAELDKMPKKTGTSQTMPA